MRTRVRDLVPPASKLSIEVVDIDKRAGRKEGMSQVLDLSLDFAFSLARPGVHGRGAK